MHLLHFSIFPQCQRGGDLECCWRCRPSPHRTGFRRWHRSSTTTRCHGRQRAASWPTATGSDAVAAFLGAPASWPPPVRARPVPVAKQKQSAAAQPVPCAARTGRAVSVGASCASWGVGGYCTHVPGIETFGMSNVCRRRGSGTRFTPR